MAADLTSFPIQTATIAERAASNPATLPLGGDEAVLLTQAGETKGATAEDIAATLPDATPSDAGKMTAADKTKLDSVASGATANATDAALRDRATHTGTQAVGTITGLATVATTGAYGDLSGLPTLGTAAALNSGTGAGNVVILDGSARLPAVDGSQLTNLPGGGGGGGDALTTNPLSQFAATTSAQLAGVMSDETGSGALVFSTGPSLVTPSLVSPDIGTPTAGNLALCSGLPAATGISGLGTGVSAALGSNTGTTGGMVLFNGVLGTPSSGTLTGCTGLPWSTGVSGKPTTLAGFGITDAVLLGGALGTPTSGTLTNCTGLPWSTGVSGKPTTLSGYGITDGKYVDDNYAIPANVLLPQAAGPSLATITTTTNGIKTGVADFDGIVVEVANFSDARPKNWDGTNPTAQFRWRAASGGTGSVTWGIGITALNEGEAVDVAPTYVQVNDAVVTAERDQLTAATAAIPIQGTLNASSRLQFWIRRDPNDGGDNMTVDARLVSVILNFALS